MSATIRIGDLLFDDASGEVFRRGPGGPQLIGRLAPQPTELLKLLVDRHPEMTTHEVIQETLWPGTPATFEKNMHFCIRKIRAELCDPASQSRYIETIPRRGYRFVKGLEIEDLTSVPETAQPDADRGNEAANSVDTNAGKANTPDSFAKAQGVGGKANRGGRGWISIGLGTCVVVGLFLWLSNAFLGAQPPIRVAIMTFEPTASSKSTNDIAELLLERLTNHGRGLQIIGPTTTRTFDGGPQTLTSLIDAHSIDYVINGRFLDRDHDQLLAEIIRASDAAHVWVAQIEWRKDQERAANTVAQSFLEVALGDG